MFSSVSHASLPSARNSRGPPKVPQGFSVRIFSAPKLSSYTTPTKLDLGYRPTSNSEQWQKQNWYSRQDSKRSLASVPRDMPARPSHFLDINTTTDHSSYESNRPAPLSNYSIYPSASKDTYIYQQSIGSKSDIYTDSETTSETFSPSSDVSAALTNDSTVTLQSTAITETSTGLSSPPLPVRQPFPIQIPALEQAQAAAARSDSHSHTTSSASGLLSKLSAATAYSASNQDIPVSTATTGRVSGVNQPLPSSSGLPSAGLRDMDSVPLSWAVPIRRESPPTTRVRRDSNARNPSTFVGAPHVPTNHQAPSHYPTGRDLEDRKDLGTTYVHARAADSYTSQTREEQAGRETRCGAGGVEREDSHIRGDSDNREPSAFDVTSLAGANNVERSAPSFYITKRELDVRQEPRTAELSAFSDSRPPDGYVASQVRGGPTPAGGRNELSPSPPGDQTRPQSHYPLRRASDELQESHLRTTNGFPQSRTSHVYSSSDETVEAGNEYFSSTSRGPTEREERPHPARRDSDARRPNSRATRLSDGYLPTAGVDSVTGRDQFPTTSLNQDLPQSYFPVRRDSDESRGSHAPSSLSTLLDTRTPAPVSARGEPASSGARETHSFSVTRSSGDRLDSPRSYIPSSQNSDERQEFRDAASFPYDGNAPSTALRETGAAGGRSTERQESLASYQPSRRDSDERRQARVVGTSLHPEMHLLNGQFPPSALEGRQVAGMRDVASKAPVDRRESPTTYYLGRGPDVYQQASRAIPDGYDPVSAPGEMGRREMQPAPEMGDFSERRESTQSVQPRGVSPGRYSGSRDSPTAASAFGRNGESHPADSLHATRMNSDDRLETSSRAVPLSSSPPEYYSSNGQDARLSANQTAPSRSAPPSRETPSLRPLSRSSPPQPLRRSSDEAPAGDITVCGAQGMLSIKRCVRWNDNLICPSPILASQRRKGWYNCRGDQLWTNDGSYKPAPAGQEYPHDLASYPEYGQGWMNEVGVRIDMQHRLIPKPLPRSALKRPQQIFQLDVGRNVLTVAD